MARRTILFAMHSGTGHLSGTFRLAKTLRARGHMVLYIGTADSEKEIRDQGFEFIPLAPDLLSVSHAKEWLAAHFHPPRRLIDKWKRRRSGERLFREFLRRIEDGHLDDCLLSCKPDLLLCDSFSWYFAFRAHRLRIPTLNIATELSLYSNPCVPPVTSSIRPGQTWWTAVRVWGAWKRVEVRWLLSMRLHSTLLGKCRSPMQMHLLVGTFRRIARKSNYPLVMNKTYRIGEQGPRLILPEIVLCPKAFDLPRRPGDETRFYFGDFVDVERREEPFSLDVLDGRHPLVVGSLGTASMAYPHARRFFHAVLEASRLKQDWQFVLQVGGRDQLEQLGSPAPNLIVRERIPQLSLLRRASVMITHGGMNSIAECIRFGVPMVIVPGGRDQPGNAVRAAYHGLAVTADMARITGEVLVRLASRAMNDRGIREALSRMKESVSQENSMEKAVQLIEHLALGYS